MEVSTRRYLGLSLVALSVAVMSEAVADSHLDCRAECDDETEFCLVLSDKQLQADVGQGFSNLYKNLQKDQPFAIAPTMLQAMFGDVADPCNRSSTKVENSTISNEGLACRVSTTVLSGTDDEFSASLIVPRSLNLSMRNDEGRFIIKPTRSSGVPFLHFSDEYLHLDWGGIIHSVIFSERYAIIETANGCMHYSYGDQ